MKHCIIMRDTPVGDLLIAEENGEITDIEFQPWHIDEDSVMAPTDVLLEAQKQLREYFGLSRRTFELPIRIDGTPFQKKCMEALAGIPYGECRTYADIARSTGNVKACRAAGGAVHRNRIVIVLPCHRVIGANGSLTGFGGGLDRKEILLRLEGYLQ